MDQLQQVWVIAASKPGIMELTSGAACLSKYTTLIFAGEKEWASGAYTAYYLGNPGNQGSFLTYIPAIIALALKEQPDLILTETTNDGRLTAAALAAAFHTSVLTDPIEIPVCRDGKVYSRRMVYGGSAIKTECSEQTCIACIGRGIFEAGEALPVNSLITLETTPPSGILFLHKEEKTAQPVNLAAAKRVIGVGRGFGESEHLHLAWELAAVIDAELACSRPVAEEEKWLPKERYIGVSGAMIKPKLYLCAGISGQIQHMAGTAQAETIVAVNKDKNSPIFKHCDYGIVGDLHTVLPALIQKFR